jgi:hypothetical protein
VWREREKERKEGKGREEKQFTQFKILRRSFASGEILLIG